MCQGKTSAIEMAKEGEVRIGCAWQCEVEDKKCICEAKVKIEKSDTTTTTKSEGIKTIKYSLYSGKINGKNGTSTKESISNYKTM